MKKTSTAVAVGVGVAAIALSLLVITYASKAKASQGPEKPPLSPEPPPVGPGGTLPDPTKPCSVFITPRFALIQMASPDQVASLMAQTSLDTASKTGKAASAVFGSIGDAQGQAQKMGLGPLSGFCNMPAVPPGVQMVYLLTYIDALPSVVNQSYTLGVSGTGIWQIQAWGA